MTEPGILIVRDDGVIPVPDGVPVAYGLIETVELLFNSLGIPTREQRQQRAEEER
jgi:hypothetical protein